MKRIWPIIGVADVQGSLRWYRSLLSVPETPGAHDDFAQIMDADGTVLLCLHAWGAHEHPTLMSADQAVPGNGLLLFFRVTDFEAALANARALEVRLEEEPHRNPNTGTLEFSLRDPDGYYVSISALDPIGTTDDAGTAPGAGVQRAVPHLPADDLRIARRFYVEQLGFTVLFEATEDGTEGILGVARGDLRLTIDCPMEGHGRDACVSLEVDDVDAVFAEWSPKVPVLREPEDEAWGARTFDLLDPFGNTLFVVGPLRADPPGGPR